MRRAVALAAFASTVLSVAFSGCTCGFGGFPGPIGGPGCCETSAAPDAQDNGCRVIGGWTSDTLFECEGQFCLDPTCASWALIWDDGGCSKWHSTDPSCKPLPTPCDKVNSCPLPERCVDLDAGTFVPPNPASGACSDAALASFVDECFGDAATTATCQQWRAAYAACSDCVIENGGPFDPNTGIANIAGCIALATGDSTQTGCAAKWTAATACTDQACSACGEFGQKQCLTTLSSGTDAGDCHDSLAAQCNPTASGFAFCIFDDQSAAPTAWAPFTAVFCAHDLDAGSDAAPDAPDAD